jgi:glyoxylase-like metal-dependent hydrolase (beta-lactamase superfamily II)
VHHALRTSLLAGFSVLALGACATTAPDHTLAPAAQTEPVDPFLQIVEPVADHVWAMRQAQPNFAGVVGNVTIIEQSRGVILVDSGATHGDGARIVAAVRRLTSKPVTAVIITHWHNDHPMGISAIREAWPNIEIIASEATRDDFSAGLTRVPLHPDTAWETRRIETLTRTYVDQIQPQVEDRTLSPEEHVGWTNALHALSIRAADTPGTYLVMPTRTFRDRLSLPDALSPVEVRFEGRAHTNGDTEVWLPRQRVLAAGDVVVWPIPYLGDSWPSEFITTLQHLRAQNFAVLVPGHGEALHDRAYIALLIRFITDVRAYVGPLAAQGLTVENITTQAHAHFAPYYETFGGSNRWLRYWFEQYALDSLVDSAYREAKGQPLGAQPPQQQ